MRVREYDPKQRALEKAASRRRDEDALRSGQVSREDLQRINGGFGLFRHSTLVRRPKKESGARTETTPIPTSTPPSCASEQVLNEVLAGADEVDAQPRIAAHAPA